MGLRVRLEPLTPLRRAELVEGLVFLNSSGASKGKTVLRQAQDGGCFVSALQTICPILRRKSQTNNSRPARREEENARLARMGRARASYSAGTASSRSSTSVDAAVFEIGM
jgi:hypothetical protein